MAVSTSAGETTREIPQFKFTTETLPAREQFDAYRQTLAAACDFWLPEEVKPQSGFRSELTSFFLGEMVLTTESHDPLEFGLTERLIRRTGLNIDEKWFLRHERRFWCRFESDVGCYGQSRVSVERKGFGGGGLSRAGRRL